MKSIITILLGIALVSIVACSKKSSGTSRTELVTKATWRYENSGLDVNKDGFIDTSLPPGYVENCDKDNTLTFKSDGTGIMDEGASKCDPGNPQSSPFTWTFKNGETVINFPSVVLSGISGDVTILKLTDTELDISKEVNIGSPTTVNVIVEFKH